MADHTKTFTEMLNTLKPIYSGNYAASGVPVVNITTGGVPSSDTKQLPLVCDKLACRNYYTCLKCNSRHWKFAHSALDGHIQIHCIRKGCEHMEAVPAIP